MTTQDTEARLAAYKAKINELLKADDYASADRVIIRGVRDLGAGMAKQLYPLAWEHAMVKGRGRLRAYFVTEQAGWEPENLAGEAIRKVQLKLAETPPPHRDVPIPGRALAELADIPAIAASWPIWKECIEDLHQYLCARPTKAGLAIETAETLGRGRRLHPTLLTAGSGRSGSSAIYDWLSGFAEVEGTRHQHFHVKDSLFTTEIEDGTPEYRARVVNFFWGAAFGRMVYSNKAQYRKVALARSFSSGTRQRQVATACRDIIRQMAQPDVGQLSGNDKYQMILDSVIGMFAAPDKKFIGNGWLDFIFARAYKSLPRSIVLCSVRDPRDIYAEHCKLTRTFDKNVSAFIADYSKKMECLEQALEESIGNIVVVRFEDFVQSEETRRAMAVRVDVDPDGPRRANVRFPFVPEKSALNIGVHRDFEDQAAIGRIGEELAKYCYPPTE